MVITSAAGAGADSGSPPVRLIAFAAANTTDPFNDIIGAFEHAHPGVVVEAEYAGTQVLATQAQAGAPFDVFVSADRAHAASLAAGGIVGDVRLLSLGHEVIVVPKENPAGIHSLRDLATKDPTIVMGVDTVPIGEYSREVLAKAARDYGPAFPAQVLAHVVSFETNVKQVLEKVALDEADAGIVYYTDVTPAFAGKVSIVAIPQRDEIEAGNYIAVGLHSANPALARALAAFAVSADGRAIFARHGYDPLGPQR